MQRSDFAYELPAELIAQVPLPERAGARLLVLDGPSGTSEDRRIRELPDLLRAGDLLVLNDTKVVPARLKGHKSSGGQVEILLERIIGPQVVLAQLRASKPIRAGLAVSTAGGTVRVIGQEEGLWRLELPAAALEYFERWGEVPLPPYIHRVADESDRERYQSVFARVRGAVAAPTASLHFDAPLLAEIEARGIRLAYVTLHVGAGTFQPVRSAHLESHVMHAERVSVSAATCAAVEQTWRAGGRIVAVGTTVVRALESAALESAGKMMAQGWAGETRLFIRPGFRFRIVDALLTNFHLPESTLLMLVCAFGGSAAVLGAYRHAVAARYRFFSYGDAMFVTAARRES